MVNYFFPNTFSNIAHFLYNFIYSSILCSPRYRVITKFSEGSVKKKCFCKKKLTSWTFLRCLLRLDFDEKGFWHLVHLLLQIFSSIMSRIISSMNKKFIMKCNGIPITRISTWDYAPWWFLPFLYSSTRSDVQYFETKLDLNKQISAENPLCRST